MAKLKKKPATRSSKPTHRSDSNGNNGNGHHRRVRRDGWENVLTGVGTRNDKRRYTSFINRLDLKDPQLTDIYNANGMGRRIVDLPADEMTRNWFKITNDEDDAVSQKLETLKAQPKTNESMKWGRLYGGGIILIGVNDGGALDKPVNEERIRAVDYLTVFDRRDVEVDEDSIAKEAGDPNFGEPEIYRITPITGGDQVRVHSSRVIRFNGDKLARRERQANNWWDQSILQSTFNHLRQVGSAYDNAEFIIEDFIQTILKIKNMMQLIASGNEALVKQRMKLLDMSRSTSNTMLMDAEEEYAKHASTVSGLAELLDRFLMALSSATGIPVTLLMGRSPAGENATGEADIRFWYDRIRAAQRNVLKPEMEKLVRYIFRSDGFKEPETWSIQFNPLQEPSELEQSTLYKQTAEGDAIYVQNGVVPAEAIAKHRFMGEEFNTTPPSIEEDELFPDEDEDETARQMLAALAGQQQNQPPQPPGGGQVPPGTQPKPTDTPEDGEPES